MGYFLLILQAVIFSFGGLLIKSAGSLFSPYMISSLRFAIGVALLFAYMRLHSKKIHLTLANAVIIAGGICKAIHYLGENIGVMRGVSYGGVLVWPVQTLVIFLISVFILKEKSSAKTVFASALCVLGVVLISWNGLPVRVFLENGISTLLAFVLAGIGAAGFSLAQKQLIHNMDNAELNCSMFLCGWLVTLLALMPTGSHVQHAFHPAGIICMLILGFITCFGFLMQGAALKTVPLLIATIIQSSSVILTILWGVLFYGDPISSYVILGVLFFLCGILLINLKTQTSCNASNDKITT